MTNTPNLDMPLIAAAQAQKHITHNEALSALDAIVQLSVINRTTTTPPASPASGDRYIVGSSATGDWAGKDHQIAGFDGFSWQYYTPVSGWRAWVGDEEVLCVWANSTWQSIGANGSSASFDDIGINTSADSTNRLAIKSDAILMSHDDVTPGNGDVQLKVNKATTTDTASLLFQNNYAGHAEMGLAGNNDFSVKVSPDGTSWTESLRIDAASGGVSIPFFDSMQVMAPFEQVIGVTPPSKGGIVFASIVDANFPQNYTASIFAYDVGSSPLLTSMVLGISAANLGTATMTGTTSASGKIGFAVDDTGTLYIENRFSGSISRQICLTFINSYRDIS